ncbi:MAG TPA: cohesin domain-containing protein [Saprospiraceae bacterium]|nr:cohesin domain-containing protein [Saprospiraceae bacterium]
MSDKILFYKIRGGAVILLILFFISNSRAQLSSYLANCGQLSVEVDANGYTGSNHGSNCSYWCNSGTYSCQRMMYNVYLKAANIQGGIQLPSSGSFNLAYSELSITLKLNRGANAMASYINEAQTEACLASFLGNNAAVTFTAHPMEDEVTLMISSATGAPPYIPFLNLQSNGPLFGIVVEAFPGESIGISCVTFTYVSNETCNNQTCTGVQNANFPTPSGSNPFITVNFGDIDCSQEEYIDLPVLVTSSIQDPIGFFDFAAVISNTAPDGFNAAPEFIDILSGTNPDVSVVFNQSTNQYIVHGRYAGPDWGDLFGTDKQLGVIRIYRPPLLCQGYTISASLLAGRIIMPGQSNALCRKYTVGDTNTASCIVPAMATCTDFQFDITTEDNLPDCSTLEMKAVLSWDPADFNNATSLQFELLRFILDIEMESGVTISDISLENFSCPGSGNDPVLCAAGCVVNSNNQVEVCINVGSPITVNNNAGLVITFDAPTGCVNGVTIRKVSLKRPGESVCQATINDPLTGDFPYCSPAMEDFIQGSIATENACWIEEVEVTLDAEDGTNCDRMLLAGNPGGNNYCAPYSSGCLCDIATATKYTITPFKNDNPLNGVTTYDLVQISKHILALEPLPSYYSMIAADANKSGTITTFDIVEFRKLILGIYSVLPNNTSWRFVDKLYVFPAPPANPLGGNIPSTIVTTSLPATAANFIGVKVGDVTSSATASTCTVCDAQRPAIGQYSLREPRRTGLRSGQVYTLPMKAAGEIPIIAWQLALRFDPQMLELIGPSSGDAAGLTESNFNLLQAEEGIVRVSWFAQPDALEEETIHPGQTLFHLSFRVKQDLPENMPLLRIDDELMPNLAWTQEGAEYALQTEVSQSRDEKQPLESLVLVTCRPNPSAGEVIFDIAALPQSHRSQLQILDAFGRRVWQMPLSNVTQSQQIKIPEAAQWPAGVYHWELRFDQQKAGGIFIRQ